MRLNTWDVVNKVLRGVVTSEVASPWNSHCLDSIASSAVS